MKPNFHSTAAASDRERFSIICFRIRFMDEAEFSLMLAEMLLHLNIWRSGMIWNLIFTIELRLQVVDES